MPETPKMTDEQKVMYTGICMCLTNEERLLWSRSQIFIIINLGALSFLGAQMPNSLLYRFVGIAGFVLFLFWSVINWKTQKMINYYQSCLASIEPKDTSLLVFRVFTGTEWKKANKGLTFFLLLGMLQFIFMIVWNIIFTLSFIIVDKEEQIIRIIRMSIINP